MCVVNEAYWSGFSVDDGSMCARWRCVPGTARPGCPPDNNGPEIHDRIRPDRPAAPDAARGRVRLGAAVLRVSASLDAATVLRDVVDAARALTGARYGVIATVDEAARPQEFICSGMTPAEEQQMSAWPDAMRLFDHLRGLEAPLRLPDLGDYVRNLGFAPGLVPCSTFCATPLRHGAADAGSFFLGEKAGGAPFDADDEELLVLFAAQAAIAIANARAYRDERRARARPRGAGGNLPGRRRGLRRADRGAARRQP